MKSGLLTFAALFVLGLVLTLSAPRPPVGTSMASPPAAARAATSAPAVQPIASPTSMALPTPPSTPGEFPTGKGFHVGDHSTLTSFIPRRALAGDRFTLGKFERPYSANRMDVYFPYLDIVSADFFPTEKWTYVRLGLVGQGQAGRTHAVYAIELDIDMDGRGDLWISAANPAARRWSTDGVEVREDRNQDVGGQQLLASDSMGAGDGFEWILSSDTGGQDAELAWVRLSHFDPNGIEFAYKTSLLRGEDTYLGGLWAGSALDPALFDLNDHYSHEQAGAADLELPSFYPIKALAEMDGTCRGSIGFVATGLEPGICPQG